MDRVPATAPRWPVVVFRSVVAVHAALVLAQAAFAGRFLAGDDAGLRLHEVTGTEVVTVAALVQIAAAVLVWRPGRRPAWLLAVSVLLFVAEVVQISLGFAGALAVHVPLGVAISGVTVALLVGSWSRPRAVAAPR